MTRARRWYLVRQILIWLVTFLASASLFDAGLGKFTSHDGWVHWFGTWGYPAWFVSVIGAAEAGAALAMLIPEFAAWAACILIAVMLGAFYTVVTNETDLSWFDPLFNMLILSLVLLSRWRRRIWPSRHGADS